MANQHDASLLRVNVSLLNEMKDLMAMGMRIFYDADDDNDGFSDADEIAYGSNPRQCRLRGQRRSF